MRLLDVLNGLILVDNTFELVTGMIILNIFQVPVKYQRTKNISMKVFIIPGNGSGDILNCMWYPWVKKKLDCAGTKFLSNYHSYYAIKYS